MKNVIQLVAVAVLFGGISAGATMFLQQRKASATVNPSQAITEEQSKESTDEAAKQDESEHSKSPEPATESTNVEANPLAAADPPKTHLEPERGAPESNPAPEEALVAVRPPYAPEGDEAGGLINLLRERARAASDKEQRLAERQETIKLIFDDLRSEQAQTMKLREQLAKELRESRQAVDAAMRGMDAERNVLRREQADIRKSADDAVQAMTVERDQLRNQLEKAKSPSAEESTEQPLNPNENANLKKLGAVFDSMPAEDVAKVFEQLVKSKRSEAVAALLNVMKERQTAKVLAVIAETKADLAADLADRLKRLKAPAAAPVE